MAVRAQRGFTLMELMISITLVAAIATGMLMAMRGGLLSLNRTQNRLDENRRALGVQRILSLQLAGVMPARTGCAGPVESFRLSRNLHGAPDGKHVFDHRRLPRGAAHRRISSGARRGRNPQVDRV